MRLVMTPDRMVVAEAMRTFTYLNLYGYLTDAVVVNRVFPDELAEGYFGAWHGVQQRAAELVESGFAPVPVLQAPYFAHEVIGAERCSTSWAAALFDGARRRPRCCTTGSTQELSRRRRRARGAAARPAVRRARATCR